MRVLLILIMIFGSVSVWADPGPDSDEEILESDEEDIGETAAEDFEDIEMMQKLEESSLRPVTLESEAFNPGLLAPYRGVLSRLRSDVGLVPELGYGQAGKGSDLLNVPGVRARFDNTPVLGLLEHQQPSVRAYLDFFDGRGKPILARWISRMGRFEPMIRSMLAEAGLPEDLIFVAMIESGFSPRATSPAAAVGVWQFIPTTGSEMGLRIDRFVDERRDPIKATQAAIKYLTWLYQRYESWPLALAAYNGGPGLVSNTIKRFNSNDYWHIQRQGGMYDETRRYVPKVLAAGLVTKNADIFGLGHVQPVPEFKFDVVEVPGNTRLQVFADAVGTSVQELRELNPELLMAKTPPETGVYELRIPFNSTGKFVQGFDRIKVDPKGAHEIHRVRFGETIEDIAQEHKMPPRLIRLANGLGSRERAKYGDELIVPTQGRGTWRARQGAASTIVVPEEIKVVGRSRFFYRVNAGDTLDTVARGLGVRSSDLLVWNFLEPSAKLLPGMIVQVYLEARPETALLMDSEQVKAVVEGSAEHKKITQRAQPRVFRHTVKRGESLWTIARRYKVTVNDLKKWNRSLNSNTLQPGQRLVVYPRRR